MKVSTRITQAGFAESPAAMASTACNKQNNSSFKRWLSVGFLVMMIFASINSSGQLLQWNTFGNAGTETTEPSVFNNTNIAAANLTQGTITAAGNSNRFGGSGWFNTGNSNPNTLANAVAGNDYIQFIVTPNVGFSFTPTTFNFIWDRSGTGPSSVTLRSSADGFAADLGTLTGLTASTTTVRTITISGLTNLATATTFRLYGYGATATTGTGGFDCASSLVNVELLGTTAATGPPVVTPASPVGTVGTPFSYFISATGSPTSYAISSGTLPADLSLNTTTGEISGTPSVAGSTAVDVTATNGSGPSSPATLSFTINPGSQTITGLPATDTKTFGYPDLL